MLQQDVLQEKLLFSVSQSVSQPASQPASQPVSQSVSQSFVRNEPGCFHQKVFVLFIMFLFYSALSVSNYCLA